MAVGMTIPYCLEEVVLVRHGQSKANTHELVRMEYGDHAIPLTEQGERESEAAGVELADFLRDGYHRPLVYCSPYKRTRDALTRLLKGADAVPKNEEHIFGEVKPKDRVIREDPRLRELDCGYCSVEEFLEQKKLYAKHGEFYYRMLHGGESPADCYSRISGFIDSMLVEAEEHRARRVLIMSHGITIRCFVMRFLRLSVEDFERMESPGNASITRLRCYARAEELANASFRRGDWSVYGLKLGESTT